MPLDALLWLVMASAGAAIWGAILLLPWQPWRTRERLEALPEADTADLRHVTVLIPARDEADVIGETIAALGRQGAGLRVILVDDQSRDGTAAAARRAAPEGLALEIVSGTALPAGWAGKMWALEQGRQRATTDLVMLLDADIAAARGLLAALLAQRARHGAAFVSLMASLRMAGFWERLLMPAFVFFFRLLYPFHLSNGPSRWVAAGAGGCILMERRVLEEIGGFGAIQGAIIDDCALARAVKNRGHRTWIGLTRSLESLRAYGGLPPIWRMVARSAYTQLRYSPLLLLGCTALMMLAFVAPPVCLIGAPGVLAKGLAAAALVAMWTAYLPTVRYYGLSAFWVLPMPLNGVLYLAMTWSSALAYWRGRRSVWKGRVYRHDLSAHDATE